MPTAYAQMLVRVFSFLSSLSTLLLTASGPLLWGSISYPLRTVGSVSGLKVFGLPLLSTNMNS